MCGHDLAMALRAAYLAMHRRTDALMTRSGVTADQFVVLCALAEGDALTQRELVTRTSSDPSTLRAMLVLLERRQLIGRRPHSTDGRARTVSLTVEGKRLHRDLWRKSEVLRKELLADLAPDDVGSLVTHLRRLTATMEENRPEFDATPECPTVDKTL
jgi:MarR family transcriptional regulator, lower aerobic nicotinate degradation pathway regulator